MIFSALEPHLKEIAGNEAAETGTPIASVVWDGFREPMDRPRLLRYRARLSYEKQVLHREDLWGTPLLLEQVEERRYSGANRPAYCLGLRRRVAKATCLRRCWAGGALVPGNDGERRCRTWRSAVAAW